MEKDKSQEDIIKDRIGSFEESRKSASNKTFIAGIILVPLGIILGSIVGISIGNPMPGIFVFFIFLAGLIGLKSLFYTGLKSDFKYDVIRPIIQKFSPHLRYAPEGRIHESIFKSSTLFTNSYNTFRGEDLIYGQLGETHFQLSEVSATEESNDDDGGERTIFKGLFIEADFHKHFHSRTYVKPDTVLRGIGLGKKKWAGARLSHMEDSQFEDIFRVFTTDEQDARYILSPVMMERLTDLQRKFNCNIHVSFQGTKMYVAIETGHMNFFDRHSKSKMDKDKTFEMISQEVEFILSVIDDLNLNTRIWSKQEGLLELSDQELLEREDEDDLYFS